MRRATRRLLHAAGVVWYPRVTEVADDVWWTGRHAWDDTVLRAFGVLLAAPFPLQLKVNCGLHALTASEAYLLSDAGRVVEALLTDLNKEDWHPIVGIEGNRIGPAWDYLSRSKLKWAREGIAQLQTSGAINEKGEWQHDKFRDLRQRLGRPPTEPCRDYAELVW